MCFQRMKHKLGFLGIWWFLMVKVQNKICVHALQGLLQWWLWRERRHLPRAQRTYWLHLIYIIFNIVSVEEVTSVFSSVAQSCLTLATPWIAAHQASLSITNSQSSLKLMIIESMMPSSHFSLCHPLLLLTSIFPRVSSLHQVPKV